jgi:hypothetical protein
MKHLFFAWKNNGRMLFAPTIVLGILILVSCSSVERDNIVDPNAGSYYKEPDSLLCLIDNVCQPLPRNFENCTANPEFKKQVPRFKRDSNEFLAIPTTTSKQCGSVQKPVSCLVEVDGVKTCEFGDANKSCNSVKDGVMDMGTVIDIIEEKENSIQNCCKQEPTLQECEASLSSSSSLGLSSSSSAKP